MFRDASLIHHGWFYHRFFDPPLAECRRVVVDLVPEGSSVLDIACGTGELCFALRAEKHCRVLGIDLSRRMLEFAQKSNPYDDVTFLHQDGCDLAGFQDRTFDYATMLLLVHELPREMRLRVLGEALRVADRIIIVDSNVPLPKNPSGLEIRIVEATFGRSHYRHFRSFLAGGGILGILEEAALPLRFEHRCTFSRDCRELVAVSRLESS